MAILEFESAALWERSEVIGAQGRRARIRGRAAATVAVAYVNHGRWLANCPFCPSARCTKPGVEFWCAECGNVGASGKEIRVDWPADADMLVVERLFTGRPVTARNWNRHLGETLEDLVQENADHGVVG